MHLKKAFLLLVCTHMAFCNDNKTYFTFTGINPVHIGAAILSGIFLGRFFMKKSYQNTPNQNINNQNDDKYQGFFNFLYKNNGIICFFDQTATVEKLENFSVYFEKSGGSIGNKGKERYPFYNVKNI